MKYSATKWANFANEIVSRFSLVSIPSRGEYMSFFGGQRNATCSFRREFRQHRDTCMHSKTFVARVRFCKGFFFSVVCRVEVDPSLKYFTDEIP